MSSNTRIPLESITLKSSDGERFEVDYDVAVESQTIKHIIEDGYAADVIPLPNVTSNILFRVIRYCDRYLSIDKDDDEALKDWNCWFVMVNYNWLLDLRKAADYLEIKHLLDLTNMTTADSVQGRMEMLTCHEISLMFNMLIGRRRTFLPVEEEEIHRIYDSVCMTPDNLPNLFNRLKRKMIRPAGRNMRIRREEDE